MIVPIAVQNMSRDQLGASDLPSGYYTIVNLLKNPQNVEGVQYAIGYYGGIGVGKMFYRTFANNAVTSEFAEVALCNTTYFNMLYPTGTAAYHHATSYLQNGVIHFSFGIQVNVDISRGALLATVPAEIKAIRNNAAIAVSADSELPARSLWFNAGDNGLYTVNTLPSGYYIVIC